MKTVDDLIQELKSLKTKRKSDYGDYTAEVIYPDDFRLVENAIREFMLDHHDSEIGEMQGKIFAYEEIIKKSNFAPLLTDYQAQPYSLDISKAEIEKIKKIFGETKETTEEEIMFHSEFLQSDDFKNADCVYYYDLSGEFVTPNDGDKILKYYNHRIGGYKFMVVFIKRQ